MKCSKCRKLLVEFSEGRLESELDREIREHVAGCAACRREVDDLRSSLELMGDAKSLGRTPEPPNDFAERVMAQVRQGGRAYSPFRRRAFGIAAVCCLLMLGTVLFFHVGFSGRPEPTPTPDIASITEAESELVNSATFRYQSGRGSDVDMDTLYHVKMELVRLLGQTLEIIERGEQEWEVEI